MKLINDLFGTPFKIELDKIYKFEAAALEVYLIRKNKQWLFFHHHLPSNESEAYKEIKIKKIKSFDDAGKECLRVIESSEQDELLVKPAMAARNIVAKPMTPISLPPNQTVTIYLSTPISLTLSLSNANKPLITLPSVKLSETWFGPKPHIGELCLASEFSGRTDLANLPLRPTRVITPVQVENQGDDLLKLSKIAIPCEFLDIYQTAEHGLWTPAIKVTRTQQHALASVSVDKALLDEIKDGEIIAPARESNKSGLLSKTLDMVFS
jgi:hypothetical protein